MTEFGREMETRLDQAGKLLRSSFGKARGAALRLSLVLEWLWCCAEPGMPMPPDNISKEALAAAATLVGEYFMPMAERVFGDAGAETDTEHDAATLARWILKEHPNEVHIAERCFAKSGSGASFCRTNQKGRRLAGRGRLAALARQNHLRPAA